MKLNIACVQFSPKVGQFEQNLSKVTKLVDLAFQSKKKPDFIIFPELALTGYNFTSKSAIEPFLESRGTGPTTSWAIDLSKKYGCFTLIGYPEKFTEKNTKNESSSLTKSFTIYNSAVLVSPSGSIIRNYRKSFLYDADYVWGCEEGPQGFETFPLILDKDYYLQNRTEETVSKNHIVNTSIGICMDLSPYKFEAPFNKFEFSTHCLNTSAKLILCTMAWLSPRSPSLKKTETEKERLIKGKKFSELLGNDEINESSINIEKSEYEEALSDFENSKSFVKKEPDVSNINYWILRFFPFLNSDYKSKDFNGSATVIFCNRAGVEDDVLYVGSSTILNFNGKTISEYPGDNFGTVDMSNPSVNVYGSLGQGEEAVLIREVEI